MFLVSRKAREGQRAQSFFWMMYFLEDVFFGEDVCFFSLRALRAKGAKVFLDDVFFRGCVFWG